MSSINSNLEKNDNINELNPVNLNLFSQLNNVLNKEKSFNIQDEEATTVFSNRKSPSVLLKHNVSKISLQNELMKNLKTKNFYLQNCKNLQKSKSAPFLNTSGQKTVKQNNNLPNNQFYNQNLSNLLTSTPNLFNTSSNLLKNDNNDFVGLENSKFNNNYQINNQLSSNVSNNSYARIKAIHVKNVSFDFKNSKINSTNILKNLNLNCEKGSIYGLLGSSGCGK